MAQTQALGPMLFGECEDNALGGLRWLSPALIGLTGPLVAGMVLVPGAMQNARAAVMAMLAVLLVVCVAAYCISVLSPSVPTGLLVDRDTRSVELISQGLIASRTTTFAFEDIADVNVVRSYDDDGYAFDTAQMRLVSGEFVALPVSMTGPDVMAARRACGLITSTAALRRR